MAEYKIDIEKSAQNILDKIYERFGVSAERLVEIAQADREGRCVVLPCKQQPEDEGNSWIMKRFTEII